MTRTQRFALALLLALTAPLAAEETLLQLRVVPQDVEVILEGEQAFYLEEERGFSVKKPGTEPPYRLEIRKAGYKPLTMELEALESGRVVLPADPTQILYLEAQQYNLKLNLSPEARLWLSVPSGRAGLGRGEYYLGSSGLELAIPFAVSAADDGTISMRAEAFGYQDLKIQLSLEELELGQWPAHGKASLVPSIPIVGPLMNWISRHRGVAIFLLLVCLTGIAVTGAKLVRIKRSSES